VRMYVTQENMKRSSMAAILTFVMEHGPVTRRAIQEESGFSWGTVSENALELINQGYLREEKRLSGGAGRAGFVLKPDGSRVVSIGLDINLSGLSSQVVGFDRSVKYTLSRPFSAGTQTEVLQAACSLCDEAMAFCQGQYRVMSIGVAFQGPVNNRTGESIRFPLDTGWIPCSVRQIFEDRYRIFTYVDHDPRCMLLSSVHHLRREGRQQDNLMLIRLDEGIGLAVMQDGVICEDSNRMELAHTISVYDGIPCECGKKGCLEAYASIKGICKRCDSDFEAVMAHTERYDAVLEEAVRLLGIAICNAAMLFHPDGIILTGKLTEQAPELIRQLREVFKRLSGAESRCQVILLDSLHVSAAFGAALKAMQECVEQLKF